MFDPEEKDGFVGVPDGEAQEREGNGAALGAGPDENDADVIENDQPGGGDDKNKGLLLVDDREDIDVPHTGWNRFDRYRKPAVDLFHRQEQLKELWETLPDVKGPGQRLVDEKKDGDVDDHKDDGLDAPLLADGVDDLAIYIKARDALPTGAIEFLQEFFIFPDAETPLAGATLYLKSKYNKSGGPVEFKPAVLLEMFKRFNFKDHAFRPKLTEDEKDKLHELKYPLGAQISSQVEIAMEPLGITTAIWSRDKGFELAPTGIDFTAITTSQIFGWVVLLPMALLAVLGIHNMKRYAGAPIIDNPEEITKIIDKYQDEIINYLVENCYQGLDEAEVQQKATSLVEDFLVYTKRHHWGMWGNGKWTQTRALGSLTLKAVVGSCASVVTFQTYSWWFAAGLGLFGGFFEGCDAAWSVVFAAETREDRALLVRDGILPPHAPHKEASILASLADLNPIAWTLASLGPLMLAYPRVNLSTDTLLAEMGLELDSLSPAQGVALSIVLYGCYFYGWVFRRFNIENNMEHLPTQRQLRSIVANWWAATGASLPMVAIGYEFCKFLEDRFESLSGLSGELKEMLEMAMGVVSIAAFANFLMLHDDNTPTRGLKIRRFFGQMVAAIPVASLVFEMVRGNAYGLPGLLAQFALIPTRDFLRSKGAFAKLRLDIDEDNDPAAKKFGKHLGQMVTSALMPTTWGAAAAGYGINELIRYIAGHASSAEGDDLNTQVLLTSGIVAGSLTYAGFLSYLCRADDKFYKQAYQTFITLSFPNHLHLGRSALTNKQLISLTAFSGASTALALVLLPASGMIPLVVGVSGGLLTWIPLMALLYRKNPEYSLRVPYVAGITPAYTATFFAVTVDCILKLITEFSGGDMDQTPDTLFNPPAFKIQHWAIPVTMGALGAVGEYVYARKTPSLMIKPQEGWGTKAWKFLLQLLCAAIVGGLAYAAGYGADNLLYIIAAVWVVMAMQVAWGEINAAVNFLLDEDKHESKDHPQGRLVRPNPFRYAEEVDDEEGHGAGAAGDGAHVALPLEPVRVDGGELVVDDGKDEAGKEDLEERKVYKEIWDGIGDRDPSGLPPSSSMILRDGSVRRPIPADRRGGGFHREQSLLERASSTLADGVAGGLGYVVGLFRTASSQQVQARRYHDGRIVGFGGDAKLLGKDKITKPLADMPMSVTHYGSFRVNPQRPSLQQSGSSSPLVVSSSKIPSFNKSGSEL